MRRAPHLLIVLAFVLAGALGSAEANFHLMIIEEVYPGSHLHPDAQYVVMRSTAAGQNVLTGHEIRTYDAAGVQLADFGIFNRNPANIASGARYIMATAAAVALFQFTATTVVTGSLPFPDGRICFDEFLGTLIDCVAYGAFTGANTNYGTPAPALQRQKALKRIRTASPRNNSTDYAIGAPGPIDETNLARPDGDADGIPNITDCAPADAGAYVAPLEVANLVVDRVPDGLGGFTINITWADQGLLVGPATVYDVVVQDLSGSATPPPYTTAGCLAPDLASAATTDPSADPPEGEARIYLARATNVCADGTYGNFNPGSVPAPPPDPRDTLDAPATTPCP
jgi:hypothetical protein